MGDGQTKSTATLPGGGGSWDDQYKSTGGGVDEDGRYHVECVNSYEEGGSGGKKPCRRFDLAVQAGDHEDQVGKTIYFRSYDANPYNADGSEKDASEVAKAQESIDGIRARIACSFGLITREEFEAGGEVELHLDDAIGKQCIVDVKKGKDRTVKKSDGSETTYEGRHEIQFGAFWPIGHEDVSDVPVSEEAMALAAAGSGDDDLSDFN